MLINRRKFLTLGSLATGTMMLPKFLKAFEGRDSIIGWSESIGRIAAQRGKRRTEYGDSCSQRYLLPGKARTFNFQRKITFTE